MKSFTPTKRAEIYLKAAEMIDGNIGKHKGYCCHVLRDLGKFSFWTDCEQHFPEFWSFHPINSTGRVGWWGDDGQGKSERVLALLFAKEMANNP